ncbi:MAG TPA: LexA family transcriptional regulator [Bacteroidia bacterium]|nr:LexA family transcriptional regulator [Bacteroidia bacterium]
MNKLARNIAHLRKLRKLSQEELAEALKIKKSRLGSYEETRSEPPLELLIRFSEYFNLPVDILLKKDLTKSDTLPSIEVGNQRVLFPITVDNNNRNLVEIVDIKASAGYLAGYDDPEFLESLPKMQLPFIKNGTCRAFPVRGDSMPPLETGALVIGRFVENPDEIKEGKTYILVTRHEGIVYKRVFRTKNKRDGFLLHSDNKLFAPYAVHPKDMLEIWEFVCSITKDDSAGKADDSKKMLDMMSLLMKDVAELKIHLR